MVLYSATVRSSGSGWHMMDPEATEWATVEEMVAEWSAIGLDPVECTSDVRGRVRLPRGVVHDLRTSYWSLSDDGLGPQMLVAAWTQDDEPA